jgi:hypothetical protein
MCRRNDAVHVASNGAKSGGTEESYKHFPPPEETLSSRVCGSHEEIIATQGRPRRAYKQRYLPAATLRFRSSFQLSMTIAFGGLRASTVYLGMTKRCPSEETS